MADIVLAILLAAPFAGVVVLLVWLKRRARRGQSVPDLDAFQMSYLPHVRDHQLSAEGEARLPRSRAVPAEVVDPAGR